MKALILSGGSGTRMKPLTDFTTKQLLPIAGRPVLFYVLDMVREAGITDIGVVVSREWGEQVRQTIGDGAEWHARFTYIVQDRPAGLAEAVLRGRDFLGDDDFVMILGDNVYQQGIGGVVAAFREHGADAAILLKVVADPSICGIAVLDDTGRVTGLQEKPAHPVGNLAIVGVYVFSPAIHQAIATTTPSRRGELEITDSMQQLVEMGRNVRGCILDGWWLDTGDRESFLAANRMVLEELLAGEIKGQVNGGSRIEGKVKVGQGTVIENSVLRGPLSINERCCIRDAVIGPGTSIGADTSVEASSVENSVVREGCRLRGIHSLKDSILGKQVAISGSRGAVAARLLLGDGTTLEIGDK